MRKTKDVSNCFGVDLKNRNMKVGDVVRLKSNNSPKMVVQIVNKESKDLDVTCIWFDKYKKNFNSTILRAKS